MKKLLLVSTAIAGAALLSSPASAAVKLDLGGYFAGYVVHANNDEVAGAANSLRPMEFRRDSEFHISGETTLDNGLTVGVHSEQTIAAGNNDTVTDEIYAYASGGWGRVNLGVEDGAAYLLQVGAPSADPNVDGMRTYIQTLNRRTTELDTNGVHVLANNGAFGLTSVDYDHADNLGIERITYLTPKYNGFQAGVTYAPNAAIAPSVGGMTLDGGTLGLHTAAAAGDVAATYDSFWEAGARWDGEFQGFGISAGAGYSFSALELAPTAVQVTALTVNDYYLNDDVKSYNGGLNLTWSGFSLGGNYMHAVTGRTTNTDDGATDALGSGDITRDTWVVGAGWANGPWSVGATFLNQQTDYDAIGAAALASEITASSHEIDKYTVGGGYSFGPGMTFRGSLSWGEIDHSGNSGVAAGTAYAAAADNDFKQVAIGADIQF